MGQSFLAQKWRQTNKWFVLGLISLMITIFLVLIILVTTKTTKVDWSWIIGYVVAFFCSTTALFLIYYAYKVLIRTENYYTYLFLFISRFGLYFIPFILAVFVPGDKVSVFGVLIGFAPIVLLPLFQGGYQILTTKQTTSTSKLKSLEGGLNVGATT